MPVLKRQQMQSSKQQTPIQQAKRQKEEAEANKPRPVIHAELSAVVHAGDTAMTFEEAQALIGWQEETKKGEFGSAPIYPLANKRIRLANNEDNRFFYLNSALTLMQEFLRGRWKFNGEPIIIGATGKVLNGQHTIVGFILAVLEWQANPQKYPAWPEQPKMEKLVVYGVAEDDATVNTMDTCKPRSVAEIIGRADYFRNMSPVSAKSRKVARMAEFAVRKLWAATGSKDPDNVRKTRSEFIALLDAHPKLVSCVAHIYEEDNEENKIGKYIPCGIAAAMMYLMGSSNSNPQTYYLSDNPNESLLNWDLWDKAEKFFVELASGADSLKIVHTVVGNYMEQGMADLKTRSAVLVKAWLAYKDDKKITAKTLTVDFTVVDGNRQPTEDPLIGGIDVGPDGLPFNDTETPDQPTPDQKAEIKERKRQVREKKNGVEPVASRKGDTWAKGDKAWIHNEYDEPKLGELTCDPFQLLSTTGESKDEYSVFYDCEDGNWETNVKNLSLLKFEMKN